MCADVLLLCPVLFRALASAWGGGDSVREIRVGLFVAAQPFSNQMQP